MSPINFIMNCIFSISSIFAENEIDGETLRHMTEQMFTEVIPVIKHRIRFLNLLKCLKCPPNANEEESQESNGTEAETERAIVTVDNASRTEQPDNTWYII